MSDCAPVNYIIYSLCVSQENRKKRRAYSVVVFKVSTHLCVVYGHQLFNGHVASQNFTLLGPNTHS